MEYFIRNLSLTKVFYVCFPVHHRYLADGLLVVQGIQFIIMFNRRYVQKNSRKLLTLLFEYG